jgi:hypothetical protein
VVVFSQIGSVFRWQCDDYKIDIVRFIARGRRYTNGACVTILQCQQRLVGCEAQFEVRLKRVSSKTSGRDVAGGRRNFSNQLRANRFSEMVTSAIVSNAIATARTFSDGKDTNDDQSST